MTSLNKEVFITTGTSSLIRRWSLLFISVFVMLVLWAVQALSICLVFEVMQSTFWASMFTGAIMFPVVYIAFFHPYGYSYVDRFVFIDVVKRLKERQ